MFFVFFTSYHGDIHLHKISRKYLKQFSSYRVDTYITETTTFNVQRVINSKVGLAEFGSCILHLISWCFTFVRKFTKISETFSNIQSWHKYMVEMAIHNIYYVQRVANPKSRLTKVTVLVFCTSSYGALQLWEISWKYLKQFLTYRADKSTW